MRYGRDVRSSMGICTISYKTMPMGRPLGGQHYWRCLAGGITPLNYNTHEIYPPPTNSRIGFQCWTRARAHHLPGLVRTRVIIKVGIRLNVSVRVIAERGELAHSLPPREAPRPYVRIPPTVVSQALF